MSEQTPHTLETCIFSGSRLQIVYDRDTRIVQSITSSVKELIQSRNSNDGENTVNLDQNQAEIVGKSVDDIINVDESRQGIIVPTEISGYLDSNSKWVFSCLHSSSLDGVELCVRFLEDPNALKQFYNSASRSPVQIEQIKKVSAEIPDFVVDSKVDIGEVMSVRLGRDNKVIGVFPYSEFLGIPIQQLFRANFLQFIHEDDHITLLQSLAESFAKGTGNAIVRFVPHQLAAPVWIQMQSSKEHGTDEPSLICAILELKDQTAVTSYFGKAFSLISSKSASFLAASHQFSLGSAMRTFMSRPVIEKLESQEPSSIMYSYIKLD